MSLLGSLMVRVSADTNDLSKGLQKSKGQITNFAQSARRVGDGMTKNITAPVMAGASALIVMTNRFANAADEIDKTSIRTGIGREELQGLRFAAEQTGVEFGSLQSSMARFTRGIASAENGTGTMADSMAKLNIALEDNEGNTRNVTELYQESLHALADMEDETQRNVIASDLFGRQFMELIPLLDQGSDGIDELVERANELGLVMSDQAVGDLVDYKDAMHEIQEEFGAVWREISLKFAPVMTDTLIPIIRNDVIPLLEGFIGWLVRLMEAFADLEPEQQKMVTQLGLIVVAAGPVISVTSRLAGLLGGLKGAFAGAAGAGGAAGFGGSLLALAKVVAPMLVVGGVLWGLYEIITGIRDSWNEMYILSKKPITFEHHIKTVDIAGRDPGTAPRTRTTTTKQTPITPDLRFTPRMAEGGIINRSGWAMVGERGPELLNLNRGAEVRPLDRSSNTTLTVNITGVTDARDMANQLVKHLRRAGVKV